MNQGELRTEKPGDQISNDFPGPQGRAEVELLGILADYYPSQACHLGFIELSLEAWSGLRRQRLRPL